MRETAELGLRAKFATLAVALLASASCLAADENKLVRLSEPVEQTAEHETFGAPLDQSVSLVALQDVASDGDRLLEQKVRVVAQVREVCRKKGCFFIAREGDSVVRVSFKDYGFFVPTDIGGKRVTLVGEVIAREITPDEASHYAEDLGNPEAPLRPGRSFEIVAESVRVPRG